MPEQYKEEIEEILKKSDVESPIPIRGRRPGFVRLIWLQIKQSLGGKAWSFSPGRIMLIAGALLLAALIMRAAVPGLVGPLAWAGLLVFIIAYGMFFIKPRKDPERRWRGQPLDDRPTGPINSWKDKIRSKFRKN